MIDQVKNDLNISGGNKDKKGGEYKDEERFKTI